MHTHNTFSSNGISDTIASSAINGNISSGCSSVISSNSTVTVSVAAIVIIVVLVIVVGFSVSSSCSGSECSGRGERCIEGHVNTLFRIPAAVSAVTLVAISAAVPAAVLTTVWQRFRWQF